MSSFAKSLVTVSLIIISRQGEQDSLVKRQVFDEEYDYIIVGAGTAGSVVASRLSEHSQLKVLLIEAGGGETLESDMPAMTKSLWGSEMDWKFAISPQTNSYKGYNGNYGSFSQGKVMGGSSTINAMAYVRGLKTDFDNWKLNYGIEGWSWDEVLPYFIRSENNSNRELNHKFHGFDGYLSVQTADNRRDIDNTMIRAAEQLGYRQIDLNDPNEPIGVALQQMTIRDGSRCSTAKAFLRPVIDRTNIHILANTLVSKINFDSNLRAISVDILKSDKHSTITARKEIIISAGAINTPKLLMLSGIGPNDHLKEHKISVVADLPVGHNFHDNPITFGVHFTTNTTKKSSEVLQKDVFDYFVKGIGPLSQFEKTVVRLKTDAEVNNEWPDIQIFVDSGSLADFPNSETAEKALNLKPEVWDQFYKPYSGHSTLTFISLLNRPLSRGTIKLRSNRCEDQPIVDPNYYQNSKDIESMVEGMKMAFSLGQTKPFSDIFNAKPFETRVPNCESLWKPSQSLVPNDDYLECMAKTLTNTYTHGAGSCRIGIKSDNISVVSPQLKVHGISGLRVVDASVVPQSPSGALYASAIMIGERGAQFILDDLHNYSELTESAPLNSFSASFKDL